MGAEEQESLSCTYWYANPFFIFTSAGVSDITWHEEDEEDKDLTFWTPNQGSDVTQSREKRGWE